jgi:tetratricopeptide (TPR) repeat protein
MTLRALLAFSCLAAFGADALAQAPAAPPKKKKKIVFEAEAPRDDSKAKAKLAAAINLYRAAPNAVTEQGKREAFERAALALAEIAEAGTPEYETVKDDADFYLAVCLYQLGLYQSALNYFDRVVPRGSAHPHYAQTLKWLALLAHRLKVDTGLLKKIATFPTDKFPRELRDELLYLIGRHYYHVGDGVRAASYLSEVTPASRFYPKSRYFLGLVAVKDDNAKGAVKAFRTVIDIDQDRGYEDFAKVKEMGALALARAYYSVQRFLLAESRYGAVQKESVLWLDSLFESSWAYFRQRKYERAMGNLFTLSTPFFESEYYPEAPIVQAVILFRNCKYARTQRVLSAFQKVYAPLEKTLSDFIDKPGSTVSAFWQLYEDLRAGKPVFGRGYVERVLSITLGDNVLQHYRGYLATLDGELEAIKGASKSFRDHPLSKTLFQEVSVQRSLAINEAGKHAKIRFARARDQIRDLLRQGDTILFEIDNAQKNKLEEELLREQEIPSDTIAGGKIPKSTVVPNGMQYWPFEGEFWRDELGHYEYQIRSDCRRPR